VITDSLDLVRDALILSLVLSAPILAVGLVVGLVISILQAVTQIQDQTLSFVPKIAAMLLVAVAILGWLSVQLMEFSVAMFTAT
jgi:flagellar biosynthesis protein FliQ